MSKPWDLRGSGNSSWGYQGLKGYLHHAHDICARLYAPVNQGHAISVSNQILFLPTYFGKKKQLQQKQQQLHATETKRIGLKALF